MLPADQHWVGKALFVAKGKLAPALTNWWYPPPLIHGGNQQQSKELFLQKVVPLDA